MSDKASNVLADRYASEAIRNIWSPHGRIVLERELWLAVMKAQRIGTALGYNQRKLIHFVSKFSPAVSGRRERWHCLRSEVKM